MNGNTEPNAAPSVPTRPKEQIVRRAGSRHRVLALGVVAVLVVVGIAGAFELGAFGPKGSGAGHGSCPTGVTLAGAGANFVLPLVSRWVSDFQKSENNQVSYSASGAGAGIAALSAQTVDFAATDDPLNTSQVSSFQGNPVLTLPITGGALAIVYNLPTLGSSPLNLSGPILAQIYLGTISTWNDPAIQALNPHTALPASAIQTVHRADAAGTTYILTDFLSQDSPTWKAGPGKGISVSWPVTTPPYVAETGNSKLLQYVKTTAFTLGYVDLTDVLNVGGVQYAAITNPSGNNVYPNLSNTQSAIDNMSARTTFPSASGNWDNVTMVNSPGANDYPLATFAYFFVYQALDHGFSPSRMKAQVIQEWLNWVVGPGQADSTPLHYASLPSDVETITQQGISSLTYNGNPLTVCG